MTIRDILKMGDARLLRIAQPVQTFGTQALNDLLRDMQETMQYAHGAGLAAPQIGVNLQVVIFGSGAKNPRYPEAPPVPRTVLINPQIFPIFDDFSDGKQLNAPAEYSQTAPEKIAFDLRFIALAKDIESDWEGCLSVPGLRGQVPRFKKIRYMGFDENGVLIDRSVDGFHARVVQHECDHLHGILYPMRVKDFSRFGFTEVLFPGLDASQDD